MTDKEFLNWLADRLVHVYNESPNVDFVHRLRKISDKLDYLEKYDYYITIAQADYVKSLENN